MSLQKNIIANYLGQGWSALISLAFVPVYIKLLGIEAYGLIGFFVALQAWLTLLDMGMAPTLNREVARQSAGMRSKDSLANLVRTFEIICFGVSVVVLSAFHISADWIAHHWLNERGLSDAAVAQSLQLMGWIAAFRVIEGLYRGAILGMQRQVWLNVVVSIISTIRAIGALLVLLHVGASIQVFFVWQALVSGVTVVIFSFFVRRQLGGRGTAEFSIKELRSSWKFAGSVFFTTVLALLMTQIDKLMLSKLLSLEDFGIYAFASAVAGTLFQLIGPVTQAFYPKFTEMIAKGHTTELQKIYHQGAQLMTLTTVPAGLIIVFFGQTLLYVWTGNKLLSDQVCFLVGILSIGTILNGWMHIPYMLQLASGWSSLAAWINLMGAIILVPAVLLVVPRFGPIGAASVWCAVNVGYVFVEIHFMHMRLLKSEKWYWYWYDLVTPSLSAGLVIISSYFIHPRILGGAGELFWIGGTAVLSYIAAILGSSEYRHLIISYSKRLYI